MTGGSRRRDKGEEGEKKKEEGEEQIRPEEVPEKRRTKLRR